ncbi:hypothetical protein MASR1M45_22690 [Candidatus Kapaibacterium sp.]
MWGLAQRLTTHEGLERYPRFSPDGKTLAFTAEYDGNNEIYTLDLNKFDEPKRITFSFNEIGTSERQGPDKIIMQWTNDSEENSMHVAGMRHGTLAELYSMPTFREDCPSSFQFPEADSRR